MFDSQVKTYAHALVGGLLCNAAMRGFEKVWTRWVEAPEAPQVVEIKSIKIVAVEEDAPKPKTARKPGPKPAGKPGPTAKTA